MMAVPTPTSFASGRKSQSISPARCFITDLRHADLRGVNFEDASLGGADFRARI
nr:pentapeptide repeat-containing protein [Bradyrhizobium diazoefficiens]